MTTWAFLPKDSRLVMTLSLPGLSGSVRAISRVAWMQKDRSSDRYDCGVDFIEISPADQGAIAGHVERGVVSPPPALAKARDPVVS